MIGGVKWPQLRDVKGKWLGCDVGVINDCSVCFPLEQFVAPSSTFPPRISLLQRSKKYSSSQMASYYATTSTIVLARNLFKSAGPAISSVPMPQVPLHIELITQAREAYALSNSATPSFDAPDRLGSLKDFFQDSWDYGLERLQRLLSLAGDKGEQLLRKIKGIPTRAVMIGAGVILVVYCSVYVYKCVVIKGGEGSDLFGLSSNPSPDGKTTDGDTIPLEFEEVELLRCPITLNPLVDPVLAADGHTYERAAIEWWIRVGNRISPMTGELLPNLSLTPNYIVRQTREQLLGGRGGSA